MIKKDLIERLKEYEGTKSYQRTKGYYKYGKFYVYKDSLGFSTIGYGHLVLDDIESFPNGITEEEADALLLTDIAIAQQGVQQLKLNLPPDSRWNDFLTIMIFQLGISKTKAFKRALAALSTANYATAIKEFKDSNWYKQTPHRLDSMLDYVLKG